MWSMAVRSDAAKKLAAIEKAEREEESCIQREVGNERDDGGMPVRSACNSAVLSALMACYSIAITTNDFDGCTTLSVLKVTAEISVRSTQSLDGSNPFEPVRTRSPFHDISRTMNWTYR